jgi:hypothetical protein
VPDLDGVGTERMLLLVVPAAGEQPPAGEDLAALVRTLYLQGYGLSSQHPLLAAALASLP